jgi:Na+/proline symporter
MDPIYIQWVVLILFGVVFFFIAPQVKTVGQFFAASSERSKQPNVFLLTSSLVISWIFAKSITNAANLGLAFGLVGGVAYAVYYFSFVVAGLVIYQLRVKGNFKSIHHFLQTKFGKSAVVVFSILIGFRLFNEVWSNTMVIGSYFGEAGTTGYYSAIIVFTVLTLAYAIKGGLRSSLLTDAIQMIFFGVMLFLLLGLIFSDTDTSVSQLVQTGSWEMATGVNLVFAALLQCFSYPFHDPVLTDRGFLSSPKTTIKSFLWAAVIGFICIVLFSLVGVYAQTKGLEGQATLEVGKLLGVTVMLVVNFIMITSAASTLDSAFSSFSKLAVVDLGKTQTLKKGRLAMVVITVLGTIPVFLNPEILSATTVSGTMVMGLAPVFLLWNQKTSSLAFHLPVGFGILVGVVLALGYFPKQFIFTTGKYADLLWANLWGLLGCFIFYLFAIYLKQWKDKK